MSLQKSNAILKYIIHKTNLIRIVHYLALRTTNSKFVWECVVGRDELKTVYEESIWNSRGIHLNYLHLNDYSNIYSFLSFFLFSSSCDFPFSPCFHLFSFYFSCSFLFIHIFPWYFLSFLFFSFPLIFLLSFPIFLSFPPISLHFSQFFFIKFCCEEGFLGSSVYLHETIIKYYKQNTKNSES